MKVDGNASAVQGWLGYDGLYHLIPAASTKSATTPNPFPFKFLIADPFCYFFVAKLPTESEESFCTTMTSNIFPNKVQ